MKYINSIIICLLATLLACNNPNNKNSSLSESKEKADSTNSPIKNSNFQISEGDSLLYNSAKYAVTAKERSDDMGFDLQLHHKANSKKYNYTLENINGALQLFYKGVVNEYLVIDDGTGVTRSLIIVNMANGEIVNNEIIYINELELKNNSIIYWTQIDKLPDSVTPPDCDKIEGVPDSQYGYIEKCEFNVDKLKVEHLGKYQCQYFQ